VRWIPAMVAAAALVAMLVLGVWQSHGVWWGKRFHDTRAQQQQQVLATAKSCAATILSYDYRHLDQDQKNGLACITGKFRDDYTQVLGFVRQSAPKLQAVQTLQIAKGGVQSVSKDGSQWVVLLYGQTVLTKGTDKPPTPRADITSAVVTLDKVGGKWLVSNMQTGG
jgi:Mce-associated membrane protein